MQARHPALLIAALTLAAGSHAADPQLARSLAATCANCHNTDGRAVPESGIEPLAGVDKEKLLRKLAEFKNGTKPATIMHQITKGYSDEQLELIAGYFAARK
ncbi:MAG: cytochrome C [Azonexus sp.]|nr:cytochrome C [Betaproteobacteria bacterium]MBK8917085.1 cytochrome C [Betaproteobacteria bacterium]MBP6037131.1 cytochrome C [Azonexus sp.]MBP6907674.1 cytochrome C [Azonexus sp.]